ncbi:LytTR family DNA-binding domain-containing protein [Clostridium ihumii]|uniref:LytTR family DNA-binding domain-containing protein n=1 Tax=Clostridium ihumii TaxID=1470356 RepID=UPI003D345444
MSSIKVEIKINENIEQAYVVIYTSEINEEINEILLRLKENAEIIAVNEGEKIVILQKREIYMVRLEATELMIYTKDKSYKSKKRLYEIGEQLGSGFMQISKYAFINLKMVDSVEPFFNGVMNLKLKNGYKEYISRKYLPSFKKYLGI